MFPGAVPSGEFCFVSSTLRVGLEPVIFPFVREAPYPLSYRRNRDGDGRAWTADGGTSGQADAPHHGRKMGVRGDYKKRIFGGAKNRIFVMEHKTRINID